MAKKKRAKLMPDPEAVRALAAEVRAFLETRWPLFREAQRREGDVAPDMPEPDVSSAGMCRLSCRFLLQRLDEAFPEGEWEVRGGATTPGDDTSGRHGGKSAGMCDTAGRWYGHYWVESHDCTVVDVTGDQFGWEPVIVTRELSSLELYRHNYADWALQEHMRRVRHTTSVEWAEAWRDRYTSAPCDPAP